MYRRKKITGQRRRNAYPMISARGWSDGWTTLSFSVMNELWWAKGGGSSTTKLCDYTHCTYIYFIYYIHICVLRILYRYTTGPRGDVIITLMFIIKRIHSPLSSSHTYAYIISVIIMYTTCVCVCVPPLTR